MRILANYGYRANGDTYSVTFETVGDVPKDKADTTVDELFRLAKAAIQRQLDGTKSDSLEFPPQEREEIPQPKKNNHGKSQLKDPSAPATRKQKSLIARLAKEKGRFIEGLNSLTMQETSETIDELMAV